MTRSLTIYLLSLLVFLPSGIAASDTLVKKNEIMVMTYNVENLFDAVHDEGKNDWQFLPKNTPGKREECLKQSSTYRKRCLESDWTEAVIKVKIQNLKTAIMAAGALPDILAVQEVENISILAELADALGYEHYILEEGPDLRGIDVGLLYRSDKLDYVSHKSYTMRKEDFPDRPTRDILGVYFRPKNKRAATKEQVLGVYVNHWVSQGGPAINRVRNAETLKRIITADREKFGADNLHALAIGDFNTVPKDWPHPFHLVIQDPNWSGFLLDSINLAKRAGLNKNATMGTYFYPPVMAWQQLDRFFVSQNLNNQSGLEVITKSYRAIREGLTTSYEYRDRNRMFYGSIVTEIPHRFRWNNDRGEANGYSDHLPMVIKVRL